ncbi:MAG: pseudaminic acid cytidylyltransferase [Crocinitomicaceae bacterium]
MKSIAIIPARGGSKRIPKKNIKEFCGNPIIAYSIEAALKSKLFDVVMVSTESEEIAAIAKAFGAEVPFLRSAKNSDDFTGPGDVVLEVLENYAQKEIKFDNVCCLFATAPFVLPKRLQEGYELMIKENFDCVFPVAEFSSPILRSLKMDDNSSVERNFPQYEKSRSQDLPKAFYDVGQFYWSQTTPFLKLENKNEFGKKRGAIILSSMEVQDIDHPEDWEVAEFKFQYIKEKLWK